ncbi:hypothetical protein FXO38_01460 [Capsicum annuum]|nr:hypothetical protein FXO37_27078 [Capsicum annuum]KAF3682028.1 hypothetical protein FXO38_01460 [Capsicum annuum]
MSSGASISIKTPTKVVSNVSISNTSPLLDNKIAKKSTLNKKSVEEQIQSSHNIEPPIIDAAVKRTIPVKSEFQNLCNLITVNHNTVMDAIKSKDIDEKDFIKKSSVDEQGKISSIICIVLLTVVIIQRDCGVFIMAYVKYLIHEKDIPHGYFDAEAFRTRYAALLWKHGTQKNKIDVVSDDESPDRPMRPQFECESSDMIIIP